MSEAGYTVKTRSWKDNWNDVVRYLIFRDPEIRRLMRLPDNITLPQFCEKYFIRDGDGTEILTDEDVRIIYSDSPGGRTRNPHVMIRYKGFDIYVKTAALHPRADDLFSNDWMKCRFDLIVERLKVQLCNGPVYGLSFEFEDEYDQWTKTPGYRRYHVVFAYKTTM